MNLYQAYLNWRLKRVKEAIKRAEAGFDESIKGMEKTTADPPNEMSFSYWDATNLWYLDRIFQLRGKESYLVEKLSNVGGD